MKLVNTVSELRLAIGQARAAGKRIGLVPTMGNLHHGHMKLLSTAVRKADFIVSSIFVNPLQFGVNEDLDSYPRTPVEDQEKLHQAGCHLLFSPSVNEMYPSGTSLQTRVSVPELSHELCGASRPGHFDGVATVVGKLFNMIQPDLAVFGQKDYQQLAVIRAMVRDLNVPVSIIGEPTVRAEDGLALSSRNSYLSPEQRAKAPAIFRSLQAITAALKNGGQDFQALMSEHRQRIVDSGMRLDYLEIRHADTLHPATVEDRELVVMAAAYLGSTRLIDNVVVSLGSVSST